jgi:hypothetical protein
LASIDGVPTGLSDESSAFIFKRNPPNANQH